MNLYIIVTQRITRVHYLIANILGDFMQETVVKLRGIFSLPTPGYEANDSLVDDRKEMAA